MIGSYKETSNTGSSKFLPSAFRVNEQHSGKFRKSIRVDDESEICLGVDPCW